jgi:hypothetical protein
MAGDSVMAGSAGAAVGSAGAAGASVIAGASVAGVPQAANAIEATINMVRNDQNVRVVFIFLSPLSELKD